MPRWISRMFATYRTSQAAEARARNRFALTLAAATAFAVCGLRSLPLFEDLSVPPVVRPRLPEAVTPPRPPRMTQPIQPSWSCAVV